MTDAAPIAEATARDLYEIGEIPPLGHVPKKMYTWVIHTTASPIVTRRKIAARGRLNEVFG